MQRLTTQTYLTCNFFFSESASVDFDFPSFGKILAHFFVYFVCVCVCFFLIWQSCLFSSPSLCVSLFFLTVGNRICPRNLVDFHGATFISFWKVTGEQVQQGMSSPERIPERARGASGTPETFSFPNKNTQLWRCKRFDLHVMTFQSDQKNYHSASGQMEIAGVIKHSHRST